MVGLLRLAPIALFGGQTKKLCGYKYYSYISSKLSNCSTAALNILNYHFMVNLQGFSGIQLVDTYILVELISQWCYFCG